MLGRETLLVLALSLGASGLSALISFVGSLTRPGGLKDQAARLNSSYAPDRPWLDLTWQLFGIATALVPVLLVAHLLTREGPGGHGGPGLRGIGFDLRRPGFDLGWGAVVAAGIGGSGLLLYLGAREAGFNLTVVPESLPEVWWKIPVLIASAAQNSVVEEVIVVGYLLRRLDQLGWSPVAALAASSLLRGSYHLYQGIGGFVGNVVMGVVFVWLYRRWGRVGPLVAAHALIDIVAFVGYGPVADRVDWL
ncbi:CPBP family intramembrane metalloprotease domain-containing protein [Streptomyces carminius]|uniref:CPBP family intramembrane metalloprotease domain-containing protein n=1 Tax=Streptomyces carminius TaxID=2665496 RepID=A0A2M8M0W7_9ACTN|nr:CPBP family intramembrane glutamic endopeptidase [Streptomyces carminius]PJE97840.1 CPBP family intramembrane metalloprotease domain-containing protein [Streptomyces carminius]